MNAQQSPSSVPVAQLLLWIEDAIFIKSSQLEYIETATPTLFKTKNLSAVKL